MSFDDTEIESEHLKEPDHIAYFTKKAEALRKLANSPEIKRLMATLAAASEAKKNAERDEKREAINAAMKEVGKAFGSYVVLAKVGQWQSARAWKRLVETNFEPSRKNAIAISTIVGQIASVWARNAAGSVAIWEKLGNAIDAAKDTINDEDDE